MTPYLRFIKNPLGAAISNHLDGYPTPINFSYLWGFGSLAGIALGVQIVTGVLLAMHYAPEISLAFSSVEHIMRDVRGGVALRYIHANGASMFFIVVYVHMFRGLYYGSYFQPRSNLWYSGIVIFFLMMATAFMGYVLPWGQMSFWGATVITNLFSAIPYIGTSIVQLLWGGFSVDNPTLNRFFSLHYLLPFAIAAMAFLHLILLHQPGSSNPLGINTVLGRIPFYPYYYVKDLFGFMGFTLLFSFFVIYAPNYLGHPDNYIEANPLVTPAHIVPEWYFLPFYAILRTIPDKLGGVLLMAIAIVIFAILPVVDTSMFRSTYFKPVLIFFFWYFFCDTLSLGWIGQEIVESPFIEMGTFVTIGYFLYFIPILPLAGFLENISITQQLGQFRQAWLLPTITFFSLPEMEHIDLSYFFNLINITNIVCVTCFVLVLSIFFPKSGELTRFVNKLVFGYFIFLILKTTFDIKIQYIIKGETPLIFDISGDPRELLFNNKIAQFLKNNSDILININQTDNLFSHLFFLYSLLIVAIFLYGVTDRFFISNSYEIEFPLLVLFVNIAGIILFQVNNFIDIILALEITTLASYVLIGFERKNRFSTLGSIQYFILGSIPSGMLILGASFFYRNWGVFTKNDLSLISNIFELPLEKKIIHISGDTNPEANLKIFTQVYWWEPRTEEIEIWPGLILPAGGLKTGILHTGSFPQYGLDFYKILDNANILNINWENVLTLNSNSSFLVIIGIFFILFNFLFKITAAPFHFWAPSVYEKGPIASVTFLSIYLKAMILFLIFDLCLGFLYNYYFILTPFFLVTGLLSIIFSILGAFSEKYIKRFFVYSSMSHVGFMLFGLSFSTIESASATFHYLAIYIISSFIMWFILLHIGKVNVFLIDLKKMKYSDPALAFIFSGLLFSMSGIPPFGGFFVKLDILTVLMDNSRFYLNFIVLLLTVISFFYYLRIIKIIYFDNEKKYVIKTHKNENRLFIITILFFILCFYMLFVQKPLLWTQFEILNSLFEPELYRPGSIHELDFTGDRSKKQYPLPFVPEWFPSVYKR